MAFHFFRVNYFELPHKNVEAMAELHGCGQCFTEDIFLPVQKSYSVQSLSRV